MGLVVELPKRGGPSLKFCSTTIPYLDTTYSSIHTIAEPDPALNSAKILFDYLDGFLQGPAHYINHSVDPKRSWGFRYSEIHIIAHSLGAPVARRMLLTALACKSEWLPKVKLIFFAPATAGARAEEILRLLFGFWYHLVRYHCPVADDLRTGSPFLKALYSETDKAVSSDGGKVFQARGTFVAEHERVVNVNPEFPWDKPYIAILSADHTSVCKPRRSQDAAYGHLKRLLRSRGSGTTGRSKRDALEVMPR
jgi:hypothetical protein